MRLRTSTWAHIRHDQALRPPQNLILLRSGDGTPWPVVYRVAGQPERPSCRPVLSRWRNDHPSGDDSIDVSTSDPEQPDDLGATESDNTQPDNALVIRCLRITALARVDGPCRDGCG